MSTAPFQDGDLGRRKREQDRTTEKAHCCRHPYQAGSAQPKPGFGFKQICAGWVEGNANIHIVGQIGFPVCRNDQMLACRGMQIGARDAAGLFDQIKPETLGFGVNLQVFGTDAKFDSFAIRRQAQVQRKRILERWDRQGALWNLPGQEIHRRRADKTRHEAVIGVTM